MTSINRLISAFQPNGVSSGSLTGLQNNLFTFSTLTDFSHVRGLLELIHSQIKPSIPSLKHIDQLLTDDVKSISQSLCEIANHKGALDILAQYPEINDLIVHATQSRQSELIQNAPADLRSAISSLKNGRGEVRKEHPIYRYLADYYFGHLTGLKEVPVAIEKSNTPMGQSSFSPAATLKVIGNFLLLGSMITSSFQREPDRQLYDGLCHMVSLDLFQTTQCHIALVGAENLKELKQFQESGKAVVLIGNHRSYFDILAAMAVFRDLSPRIVAKDTLRLIPVLGWTPLHHPLQPSRWYQDGLLSEHPLIDRKGGPEAVKKMNRDAGEAVANGHALFAYPEGTRSNTPDRSYEWGIRLFKDGIFHIAQELGDVVIAGLHCYGLGCVVPNSLKQDLVEGTKLRQPVILSVSKPRHYTSDDIQMLGTKKLNRNVWWDSWQELAQLQALAKSELAA